MKNGITVPFAKYWLSKSFGGTFPSLLDKLGFIQKTASGGFRRKEALLTTGTEAYHGAIHSFQRQTMALAEAAIDGIPKEKRALCTLTLSLSEEAYLQCKERIVQALKDMLESAKEAQKPDRVYQLNIQMFPLTQIVQSKSESASSLAPKVGEMK